MEFYRYDQKFAYFGMSLITAPKPDTPASLGILVRAAKKYKGDHHAVRPPEYQTRP